MTCRIFMRSAMAFLRKMTYISESQYGSMGINRWQDSLRGRVWTVRHPFGLQYFRNCNCICAEALQNGFRLPNVVWSLLHQRFGADTVAIFSGIRNFESKKEVAYCKSLFLPALLMNLAKWLPVPSAYFFTFATKIIINFGNQHWTSESVTSDAFGVTLSD